MAQLPSVPRFCKALWGLPHHFLPLCRLFSYSSIIIYIHLTLLTPGNLYPCVGAGRGKCVIGQYSGSLSSDILSKLLSITHILYSPRRARLLEVKSQELTLSLYSPSGSEHRMPSLPQSGPIGLRSMEEKLSLSQNVNAVNFLASP